MKYRGLILDFDGVIVDSEKHWATLEGAYLRKNISGWESDDYAALIGKSLKDAHSYLRTRHGFSLKYENYSRDYSHMAADIYASHCQLYPGLKDLLMSAKAKAVKVGIASSSKREWIEATLRRFDIEEYIDAISAADDANAKKAKPAPDTYLEAAKLLGHRPNSLLAIEDSFNGVESAKSAGLFCLGFRNDDNSDQDLGRADMVIRGFSADNINTILSYL